jgi:phosphate/sulfate permease
LEILLYCRHIVLWLVGWYMPLVRRVLVWMIGFISSLVTHSLLNMLTHRPYSAIADLHTFQYLQFTIAHTLGFPVSTSHLLVTDLITQTITVSLDYALQVLHIKSFHRSTLHNSLQELTWTVKFSLPLLFSLAQLTTAHTKSSIHTFRSSSTTNLSPRTHCEQASVSPINSRSDTWKNAVFCTIMCWFAAAQMCLSQCCVTTSEAQLSMEKTPLSICCIISGMWLQRHCP